LSAATWATCCRPDWRACCSATMAAARSLRSCA